MKSQMLKVKDSSTNYNRRVILESTQVAIVNSKVRQLVKIVAKVQSVISRRKKLSLTRVLARILKKTPTTITE